MKGILFFTRKPCNLARCLLCGVLLIILTATPGSGQTDFIAVFGSNYLFAKNFITRNSDNFRLLFPSEHDARVAAAVVFPELIRYGILRDIIETAALRALYVRYGSSYANFSIGPFQMKPEFAEKLEKEWVRINGNLPPETGWHPDTTGTAANRALRVERLSTIKGQFTYLHMFYRLMEERFAGHDFASLEEKIRVYATAYNAGMGLEIESLNRLAGTPQFHTSLFRRPGTVVYNYSEISIHYASRGSIPAKP
jgi:hypothetical protein